jgi:hypothetical protein
MIMKRKLIFVILIALVFAPVTAFAAPVVNLDYDRDTSTILVKGTGFGDSKMTSVLSSFTDDPTWLNVDHIAQVTADANGVFDCSIPTAKQLVVGNKYCVQLGSSALDAPTVYYVELGGISALLNTPVRTTLKLNTTVPYVIASKYDGTDWTISSSNTNIVQVLTEPDGTAWLNGIEVLAKKTGSAMLTVKAGGQGAVITVTVTT